MPLVIDSECVWCRNCPANRVHTVRHLILDNNSQIALGLLANRFDQDLVSSKHTQSWPPRLPGHIKALSSTGSRHLWRDLHVVQNEYYFQSGPGLRSCPPEVVL